MSRGPLFVRPEVFKEHLQRVGTLSGDEFTDPETIYGDMSRLVVAWLATAPADELGQKYAEYGWGGNAAVRAIQAAARDWLRIYHPDRAATQRLTNDSG
jgi:hypothetical protein